MNANVVLVFCVFSLSTASLVKWLPTCSFNMALNFKNGELPCSRQRVVFPERLTGNVVVEADAGVAELVLPVEGEIDLARDAIYFGADPEEECRERDVYYFETPASWSQPDAWSSARINEATPDAERLPCFDDIVEIPEDNTAIELPEVDQQVSEFWIGNSSVTNDDIKRAFVLNSRYETGIVIKADVCRSRSGCPCQKNQLKMDCSLKFCPVPQCVHPVLPEGSCCKVCGGTILFDIDHSFDFMAFKQLVEDTVESYGKEKVVYHLSRLPSSKIQLVVIDSKTYDYTSAIIVNAVDRRIEKHWVQSYKNTQISGSPWSRYGLGGKIFGVMLLAVTLVMGAIYAYYYKLPEVSIPMMGHSSRGMLGRFQRRTDSVISLTRRDSGAMLGGPTAFRNPMYDSKRGRVQVAETVAEENLLDE